MCSVRQAHLPPRTFACRVCSPPSCPTTGAPIFRILGIDVTLPEIIPNTSTHQSLSTPITITRVCLPRLLIHSGANPCVSPLTSPCTDGSSEAEYDVPSLPRWVLSHQTSIHLRAMAFCSK